MEKKHKNVCQKFLIIGQITKLKFVILGDVCWLILSASELFIILQLVLNVRDNLVTNNFF
jgi:hypothetical protein